LGEKRKKQTHQKEKRAGLADKTNRTASQGGKQPNEGEDKSRCPRCGDPPTGYSASSTSSKKGGTNHKRDNPSFKGIHNEDSTMSRRKNLENGSNLNVVTETRNMQKGLNVEGWLERE
jgi:hypothetical protein